MIHTLDQVLEYYRCKEPSSPIPLLIRRAKKLVPMGFIELIADLAPAGLAELKAIGGIDGGEAKPSSQLANGEEATVTPASGAEAHSTGELKTRSEVVGALDQVLDYYRTQEPSSPVPLIVARTKRLVPMNFVELVADLAPSSLEEIQRISGVGEEVKGSAAK